MSDEQGQGNIYVANPAAGELNEDETRKAIEENEKFLEQFKKDKPEKKSDEQRKGVIILGCLRQDDYPIEAPVMDDFYDVWAINNSWEPERWTHWFQLHGIEHMMEKHGIQYIRWLQAVARYHKSKKLYVFDTELHHFPGADEFPITRLCREFGNYFTGSFAYLVAFAIMLKYQRIWIDTGGMEGEEWAIPCIEYYIGIAEERGIIVHVPRNSGLLHRRLGGLYGIGRHRGGNYGDSE